MSKRTRIVAGLGMAVASTALCAGMRWALDPILGNTTQYVVFDFAVVLVAILCGRGMGLVTLVLSAITATWFFVPPRGRFWPIYYDDVVRLIIFCLSALFISLLAGWARTERHKAQAHARQLDDILNNMADAYVLVDSDLRLVMANKMAEQYAHQPETAMEGLHLNELVEDAAAHEPFERRYRHALATGQHIRFEEFYSPRGLWLEVDAYPKGDRLAIFFRDTTERRKFEEELQRSERFNRLLIECSMDCVKVMDLDGRLRSINKAGAIMLEVPDPQTLIGVDWVGLWREDARPAVREAMAIARAGGVGRFQTSSPSLRGTNKWWDVQITAIPGDDGQPEWLLAMSRDISELKNGEMMLLASERKFRRLYDASIFGAICGDVSGRLVDANDYFLRLLGYGREDLPHLRWDQITPPEYRDGDAQARQELLRSGTVTPFEKEYFHRDGHRVPVLIGAALLEEQDGQFIGFVLDLTDLKRAEREAQQAKAAAEAANAAKDHFLAVLSHELRTPLSPVLATASMLQEDPRLDADQRQSAEVIQRNAELEARLIDDLLDVTRITRGKVELEKQVIDLAVLLHHAVEVCRQDIAARNLHFELDLQHPPFMVDVDAARMQQVIWNLLKNAIKFTPHGGCVGLRCGQDRGQIVVTVSDSGVGIEPELLPRLFNAFEQGGMQTTRRFGGLGLGLTISKALVEMHGGTIEALSPGRGGGAVFTIRLPAVQPASPGSAPGPGTGREQHENNRSLRILLVDDHGDTLRILERLLARRGHRVQTASDVGTAVALATREEFDVLVSDLGLPDGTGIDLLQELRARGRHMPAIALSGYGTEEDRHRTREAGFAEHLVKPVNSGQLVAALDHVQAVGTHP